MTDGADFWVSESAEKTLAEATNDVREIVEMTESIDSVTPQYLMAFYKSLEENTNKARTLLEQVKVTRYVGMDVDGEGLWVPAEVENTIAKATFLVGRVSALAMQLRNMPFKELSTHHRKLIKQAKEAHNLLESIEVKASETEKEEEIKSETPNMDPDVNNRFDSVTATYPKKKVTGARLEEEQPSRSRKMTRRKARMGSPKTPIEIETDDDESNSEGEQKEDDDWTLPSPNKKKNRKERYVNGRKRGHTSKGGLNNDLESDEAF